MEKNTQIQVEKIMDPPEKMRLMYEAVSKLMRQNKEIAAIKVSEITAKAGIGKGTAYEYFSSKEDLIAHALMYEYSNKLQSLVKIVFQERSFQQRCYRIMDWIKENRDYNRMFTHQFMMKEKADLHSAEPEGDCFSSGCNPGDFGYEVHSYIYSKIDAFMEDAYREGAITETDLGKRSLALLTSMVEYAFVIMTPSEARYDVLGEDALREFIFTSLVRALN